jgi:acetyl/propionyl-CoA carboxylase alpha subunit/acetyl-CoA carboxylase carboxyltransferase component
MNQFAFSRIAIVNRGESAARAIRAIAELNRERAAGLVSIALHTGAERSASFVRQADEAFQLDRGRVPGEPGGNPYLDYDLLAASLKATGADAAWVGWGFVAEHAEFAELCDGLGITFIGPSAEAIRLLGDKIEAKRLAEQVGVPVAAWSGGGVESVDQAQQHAADIGYPLLIKAAAGGGGRGIRRVHAEGELAQAFSRARDEAEKSFGDPTVFMEKLVTGARHVEVQIAADGHGGAWALGVRDCSVQRRDQKIIEESASPVLSAEQNAMLGTVATDLAVAAGYRNVGTVEFLYDPAEETFAFLEVNTRLQVEHPITELTTGIDLVKLQLELASGRTLEGEPPAPLGHAIEARLNAEDPIAGFTPTTGEITTLRFPTGPGLRVDTGVVPGDRISPDYDAMVAKVMAWGRDRNEAIARLTNGLVDTVVAVEGGAANTSFLIDLLQRPEFVDGSADTAWVDRLVAADQHLRPDNGDVAILVAAAEAYLSTAVYARTSFFAAAARGRPNATHDPVTTVDCRLRGEQYQLQVRRTKPDTYQFDVDGASITMSIRTVDEIESRVTLGGRSHRVRSFTRGRDHLIEVDNVAHIVSREDAGIVRSPSPSLVISVPVEVGARVSKGDAVAVLEAMKMETVITAPFDGTVTAVLTGPSVQVDAGTPLLSIEPGDSDGDGIGGAEQVPDRIDLARLADRSDADAGTRERFLRRLEAGRWTVLGYDIEGAAARAEAGRLLAAHDEVDLYDPEIIEAQLSVITAFSDLGALARNRRIGDPGDEQTHNPTEFFHRYLRSLDVEAEGLPQSFRDRLERAFAHYGIDDLEPTLKLQRAAFRVFHAQQAAATHVPLVAAALNGLRLDATRLDPTMAARLADRLEEFVRSTELRFPVLGAQARSLRYEVFDQPTVLAARAATMAEMQERLDRLRAGTGDGSDFEALMRCPEAVARLLAHPAPVSAGGAGPAGPDPLLTVMFRRLYRAVELDDLTVIDGHGSVGLCAAGYSDGRAHQYAIGAVADLAEAAQALAAAIEQGEQAEPGQPFTVDCYLRWDGSVSSGDDLDRRLTATLDAAIGAIAAPAALARVTLSGADPTGAVFHHTYRPDSTGAETTGNEPDGAPHRSSGTLVEDRADRDIHPMIAARLGLSRFDNFTMERLDSTPGIYTFRATGVDNPKDVRLIAAAELRDLTPRFDDQGRVVAFPTAEQAIAACADNIRAAQNASDPKRRLAMNRIVLYVWPPFDHPLSALESMEERLATITDGLGLEGIEVLGELPDGQSTRPALVRFGFEADGGRLVLSDPDRTPVPVLDRYQANVLASRQRGSIYPYELAERLVRNGGTFTEYDLAPITEPNTDTDTDTEPGTEPGTVLRKVLRPAGHNEAGFVAGVISTPSDRYPEGMTRVVLMGDPTKGLASIAEAECRLVIAACDLAEEMGAPLEWYALSAGARIAMDTGTENMDWISRALRRIIEFTQDGGEINVVVTGINVGAQPYWNAEATMLMHTKGILVMTPDSAMVLTGKQSLDYSGGVSAEDNFGIGGYDRIMGPNGQAQYWAPDLDGALDIVQRHYEHAYTAPGERFPRTAATADEPDRDVSPSPHSGDEFETVGQVFSEETNPGRKKPFDMASIMRAVADIDHQPLERWADMRDADTAIVHESQLNGVPVMMIGISSRAIPRTGMIPADGPDQWTSGTLFPMSSKKIARAINAASGSRPLVVLANLSGFDGSPESLARHQLEFGAEIGRAITNFDGPIVFCVVSRYHGGAFVVFSKTLNDNMEALAVEGTYASVLGGAPAAAVVFTREVDKRTDADPRVVDLSQRLATASGADRVELRAELDEVRATVRAEKLGEKASEFDAVHTVERARDMGSVDRIIPAVRLRPELIAAVERGMARATEQAE